MTKSYNNWNTDKTAMSLTFPKKWWIESDFTAQNLKLSYTALLAVHGMEKHIYSFILHDIILFFLDLELDDGEMEEAYEAFPLENSHWKANEAGKMIRQRGAWGIYR